MMQQPPGMAPMVPPFPLATTESIQKCLDENKKLILAILDNQNLGKLADCAKYQMQLQRNLLSLAAIADGQPQGGAATMSSQIPSYAMMQPGGSYIQPSPIPPTTGMVHPSALPPNAQFTPQEMSSARVDPAPGGPGSSNPGRVGSTGTNKRGNRIGPLDGKAASNSEADTSQENASYS